MQRFPVSACCFIRNNWAGFCLFESMASLLPLVDEYVIMDLGSDDGTLFYLEQIAQANPRVKLKHGTFPSTDANAFAVLANDLITRHCGNQNVWYYQSDEVPHQHLLGMIEGRFSAGHFDLSFWRLQLGYNWQEIRWLPHLVHRCAPRDNFRFTGDGMNSDRVFGVEVCSTRNAGWFSKWGELYASEGPASLQPWVQEMLLDVSLLGGFRNAIPSRRQLHSPFWHETPVIPYRFPGEKQDRQLEANEWMRVAVADDRWTRTESPYDIPHIMKYHVGKVEYQLRRELFEAICDDDTTSLLGL